MRWHAGVAAIPRCAIQPLDWADGDRDTQGYALLTGHDASEGQHQRLGSIRRLLSALLCVFLALNLHAAGRSMPVADAGELSLHLFVGEARDRTPLQRLTQRP